MNYDYSFSEKNNRLSLNAYQKMQVKDESHADLVKTQIVSKIDEINAELTYLSQIGLMFDSTINVSSLNLLSPVTPSEKVVLLTEPNSSISTPLGAGNFGVIVEYENELIYIKLKELTETSPLLSIRSIPLHQSNTWEMEWDSIESGFLLKRKDGGQFTFNSAKFKVHVISYSGDLFETTNGFDSNATYSNYVLGLPASTGLKLSVNDTVVSQTSNVLTADLDAELINLLSNVNEGFEVTKTAGTVPGTFDLNVKFQITESNYEDSLSDIVIEIVNGRGTVTYE